MTEFQSGQAPSTVDPQLLHGPSHDGESPARPQFLEGEEHPNDASQLEPPGIRFSLAQSTGSGLEQPPWTAQSTGTREAVPHRHRSAAKYLGRCNLPNCVTETNFKRPQELERHVREVHGPPTRTPKCPFCLRTRKRAYLMKNHLVNDHSEEFTEDVFQRLLVLEGKDLFAFVDTIRPPQS